jgi:hypothetical protein
MSSVRFIVVMRMWTYFHANMRNINSIYYIILLYWSGPFYDFPFGGGGGGGGGIFETGPFCEIIY